MLRLAFLLVLPLLAQDPRALLERGRDLQAGNAERAARYTLQKLATFQQFKSNGAVARQRSETYDVVFLEGAPYERLIARNGQPLSAKDAAKEDAVMKKTAEERRRQRKIGNIRRTVKLPELAVILEKFDLRFVGEDTLDGRATWVVEATPRTGLPTGTQDERDLASFSRKFWLAKDAGVPLRRLDTVIREGHYLAPGSTVRIDYALINDDAWLVTSMVIDYRARFAKVIKASGRTEYKMSGFRKFDVQSTITADAETKPPL